MPYTPPSQLSPTVSKVHTPIRTRSQSCDDAPQDAAPASSPTQTRPDVPRSSSYLSRHRRSPSVLNNVVFDASAPAPAKPGQVEQDHAGPRRSDSLRQSPPPRSDAVIPIGAVVSPPESSHASSDDDESPQTRGRELRNLEELQAAIRNIEQRRGGSPEGALEEIRQVQEARGITTPPTLDAQRRMAMSRPLSAEARKISHSRSSTETAIPNQSESASESDSEGSSPPQRPHMVRKKSGELVKPALRPASVRRRPSSMPGTPTYNKAVHFDAHLEHIRHFLQVDRPLAVSAGSSPVEQYESEGEFPFGEAAYRPREPPFEWDLVLSNFPHDVTMDRAKLPIKVERVFLSADNKNLVGTVAVANLSFHKLVVARFTLDYWKTTSEVVAEYNNDVRRKQTHDGIDRFNFNVKLADQANLESKTMFFCVRYNVNGQEYWDNNNSMNYQVEFRKKAKPQHGKQGMTGAGSRPLNALPRSRPSPPLSAGRPKSMPASFDDFAGSIDSRYDFGSFRQPSARILGEDESPSRIRLKGAKPGDALLPDSPARKTNPAGQAFGNRYDFGASLSAAISAANTTLGDRSGLKSKDAAPRVTKSEVEAPRPQQTPTASKAGSVPLLGPDSEKPALQSPSYTELLDRYCFYGSAKSSPTAGTPAQRVSEQSSDQQASTPPLQRTSEGQSLESSQSDSSHRSRSASPNPMTGHGPGSEVEPPVAFGYPYHHTSNTGFPFGGTHTPTAIHG